MRVNAFQLVESGLAAKLSLEGGSHAEDVRDIVWDMSSRNRSRATTSIYEDDGVK